MVFNCRLKHVFPGTDFERKSNSGKAFSQAVTLSLLSAISNQPIKIEWWNLLIETKPWMNEKERSYIRRVPLVWWFML